MSYTSKEHMLATLDKGLRLDGRKFDEYRKVIVEYGASKNAEGSARVKIGDTEVIAGVKMSIEKPYPDSADQGNLMVNAELMPMSNPEFEPGPPRIDSIEISRIVDRGIRESKMIDLKALCVEEGEKVWSVMVDICTINDDGNLIDVAGLAAIAALRDAKFPGFDGENVDYKQKTDKKLPLASELPIQVNVIKIGKHLLVDPTIEEEGLIDARVSLASCESGSLHALQKGGEEPLDSDVLMKMVDIAIKKSKDLRTKL